MTLNASPAIYFPHILVEKSTNLPVPKSMLTVVNMKYLGPVLGCYV